MSILDLIVDLLSTSVSRRKKRYIIETVLVLAIFLVIIVAMVLVTELG